MKICGVIAEYDPFHRGHELHLRRTREMTGCDFVIAVMSGSVVQRGRLARFDKFARARAALLCGADAVFELPALFSLKSAEGFARGGAEILSRLGADVLSFGVEADVLPLIGRVPETEPLAVSEAVALRLSRGETYARAWGGAMAGYLNEPEELLSRPNFLLALEYRKAARGRVMELCAVPRTDGYHETGEDVLSASAVRALLEAGEREKAAALLPQAGRFQTDAAAIDPVRADAALLWALRSLPREAFIETDGCGEGLDARLYRAVRSCASYTGAAEAVKTKRYTRARIDRALLCAALGITKAFAQAHPLPGYARLLGFRADRKELLAELDRRSGGFLVSDAKRLGDDPVFRLENRATDLWASCCDSADDRICDRDYGCKMIVV